MGFSVAIVGTGASPENRAGHSIAYRHGAAYRDLDDCSLVACCDIVRENAEQFAAAFDIDTSFVYEDYKQLLTEVSPDIVSVCTSPRAHAPLVIGCAKTNVPEAIHCEKPMAPTWKECQLMAQECQRRDIQLTFTHQRRFVSPWRTAKELLDNGDIGELERIEVSAPNFFDWGVHMIDLANMFNNEKPAAWVIGQLDYREENVQYGVHNENQMFANWEYDNGVYGLAATGQNASFVGDGTAGHRLLGTEGIIEIGHNEESFLRIRQDGRWKPVNCDGERLSAGQLEGYDPSSYYNPYFNRAIENIVDSLHTAQKSPLRAKNALSAMEIIFAGYESARRRSRIDLPLTINDNPLEAMVESGTLTPTTSDE